MKLGKKEATGKVLEKLLIFTEGIEEQYIILRCLIRLHLSHTDPK